MISHVIEAGRSSAIDEHAKGDMRVYASPTGLTIVGWVLGRKERVTEVATRASGQLLVRAPVDVPRPDIVKAFGDEPGAERSGFRIDLQPETAGISTLVIHAVFSQDTQVELGTARIRVFSGTRLIPLRKAAFSIFGRRRRHPVRWAVLSPPAERQKVLPGTDGWLFLHRDPNDVIGQHVGRVRLKRKGRRGWASLLKSRIATLKSIGSVWLCAVIPDKNFVYPEYLPAEIEPARKRLVHEFLELARGLDAPILYGLEDLQAAKKDAPLFPKTDTHWSHRGAYVAYQSICRDLSCRGLPVIQVDEAAIQWKQDVTPGDLGSKLYPHLTSVIVRAELRAHKSRNVFDNCVQNHGRVLIFERDWPKGLTCVLFGESFAQNLLLFLKESFRRLVFVHTSMLVSEILEVERPDVVLSTPLERFLLKVPDDRDALAQLGSQVSRKVELGRVNQVPEPFLHGVPRSAECGKAEQIGKLPWLEGQVHGPVSALPAEAVPSRRG
jgi:alginate O-acetyltransferase complex protein AlgJ